MYRIDGKDADAIGLQPPTEKAPVPQDTREFNENMVWDLLKSVYDPEIPVNIVDLGLIYSCKITPAMKGEQPAPVAAPDSAAHSDGKRIDIEMSMTAPGCGMGGVLKADVESKLARL